MQNKISLEDKIIIVLMIIQILLQVIQMLKT